jgi:hypothetical protein
MNVIRVVTSRARDECEKLPIWTPEQKIGMAGTRVKNIPRAL